VRAPVAGGAQIDGTVDGNGNVQLASAPTSFQAPLHVTSVSRAGYAIHARADLIAACAVPLADGEAPSFGGTFLFSPLNQQIVDAALLATDTIQSLHMASVYVSNLPLIVSATTNEPSLQAAVQQALHGDPMNAGFTSSNWQLLCDALDSHPDVRVLLSGDFSGGDWEAEIRLNDLDLALQ
jgi:hypothetical protein